MNWHAMIVLSATLAASTPTVAAQMSAVPQPPPSARPVEFQNWLDSGERKDRLKRLTDLGVDRQVAESFTAAEHDVAQWMPLRSASSPHAALLFLPCGVLYDAHLYALSIDGKAWHTTASASFDCHYDRTVSVTVASIRSPAFEEILVHRVCVEHGSGFLQQNIQVLGLANEKLKTELETQEVLHDSGDPRMPTELDQKSVFAVVQGAGSGSRSIKESRSTVRNGVLTVDRRVFRWNSAKARYLPSKFHPVNGPPRLNGH